MSASIRDDLSSAMGRALRRRVAGAQLAVIHEPDRNVFHLTASLNLRVELDMATESAVRYGEEGVAAVVSRIARELEHHGLIAFAPMIADQGVMLQRELSRVTRERDDLTAELARERAIVARLTERSGS